MLIDKLYQLGHNPRVPLIVHSSFKQLSELGFTPDTVIEALMTTVGSGSLIMPTMTWRTVNAETPEFFESETPGQTGILTERFRIDYANKRTLHPTHSVAIHGPLAFSLGSKHYLDLTPCGPNSPFYQIVMMKGEALLIDVDWNSCTCFHVAEELSIHADSYVVEPSAAETYACYAADGENIHVAIQRHVRYVRQFNRLKTYLAPNPRSLVSLGPIVIELITLYKPVMKLQKILDENPQFLKPPSNLP